ncbi:MAG: hypothetical protein A3G25_09025 [Betaproteobacteria bacterium RIFCSPLOWO2_12_FULL_63_13]|nr:MAG: hypothetical protein A3G25_09025 [Betaproteobacteria bacterium RIFCSPLOWO2_12_FULL_63_13]
MNCSKALLLASALLAFPGVSTAQQYLAYTTNTVLLRAGPAREFPVVAVLQNGDAVAVQGCLQDYSWCDVVAGPNRGWLDARYIAYPYQGATVPVIDYGAAVGIGVVTFIIGSYWHDHYVARPWYRQLPHWSHRPQRAGVRAPYAHRPGHRPPRPAIHPRPPHKVVRAVKVRPVPVIRPLERPPRVLVPQRPLKMGVAPGRMVFGSAKSPTPVFLAPGRSLTSVVRPMGTRNAGVRPGRRNH